MEMLPLLSPSEHYNKIPFSVSSSMFTLFSIVSRNISFMYESEHKIKLYGSRVEYVIT